MIYSVKIVNGWFIHPPGRYAVYRIYRNWYDGIPFITVINPTLSNAIVEAVLCSFDIITDNDHILETTIHNMDIFHIIVI